jgi:hypothetical protein
MHWMVQHIQTKIWFTYNNRNNYGMVAIRRLILKRDKNLKKLVKKFTSYNVTILIFIG